MTPHHHHFAPTSGTQPSKSFPCPTIANLPPETSSLSTTIGNMNGEDPPERPGSITTIINGLERYNPEAVGPLEAYLQEQCEQKYCDSNANRTLLKL
jgi:hypothetical protein